MKSLNNYIIKKFDQDQNNKTILDHIFYNRKINEQ